MNVVPFRRKGANKHVDAARHMLPAEERRAQGKALRDAVPREAHGTWKAPKDRRDPVDLLRESNKRRLPQLVPIRFGRMLQSPFTFYRGAAAIMAADLASTPASGIRVQACGDAHLLNFGGFATPERRVVFDINDLDETLPAPWEWDVKRLAASIVIAGRDIRLSDSESTRAAKATVRSYRKRMYDYAGMRALDVWYDAIDVDRFLKEVDVTNAKRELIAQRLEKARERSTPEFLFPKLAGQKGSTPHITDEPPLIFHATEAQAPGLKTGYREAIARYRASLPEHVRVLFERYAFCDMAMKVVGIGSVGTICGIGLFMAGDDDPLFLQIKEAGPSVLERYAGKSLHENHGQRVIAGQRLMQSASDIFLGWTRTSDGRDRYVRQLRDMKITPLVEDFDADDLRAYGRMCGWALAHGHARSGDAAMIAGYMGTNDAFDDAICEFAHEYADQNRLDHRALVKAVREGRVKAITET
jgi:uncharacterized protein (DUF2252 family)